MNPGWRQLLAYGLPGLPLAILGLPLYVYLPTFYAQEVGLSVGAVGLALLIARTADVVTDPLVGSFSDGWRRWRGSRSIPMVAGTVVLIVGVENLFRPAPDAGFAHLLGWALVAYFGWTLVSVPYAAWGAEITRNHHGRSSVSAAREGMVILGTLFAVAWPAMQGIAGDAGRTLDSLASVIWWLLPLAVLVCTVTVEKPAHRGPTVMWRDGIKALRANRPFARLIAAYLLNGLANGLPASLFLLFVTHVLGAPDSAGPLLVTYFIAGVAFLPLWLRLARRTGKHRAWAYSMLTACTAFTAVPFLGSGDVAMFFVICLASGAGLGADMALSASLQADVVDVDRANGAGGRAGLYFGLWGMATKVAVALAVGIAFPLLELGGFSTDGDNSREALLVLSLLYGALPVTIKLGAVALIWNFPLDANMHRELNTQPGADDRYHEKIPLAVFGSHTDHRERVH